MSDLMSEVAYDIRNYESLCSKYGENVRHSSNGNPDCYGAHARKLEKRAEREEAEKSGKKVPIETEVKLRVNEDVICRLEKELGNSWDDDKWERQENIIYRTGDGIIRFRKESGEVTLTIKGKRAANSKYNERPEVECSLPRDFFDKVLNSGCSEAVVYEKQRATYENLGCEICLDRLGEQYFVEIEGTKERIDKNIRELRLTNFLLETRDYAQIVSGKKEAKRNGR